MENIILKKENGEVRIINVDMETINKIQKQNVNPCFTCDNGYASKCQKMFDFNNKNINNYDFITDGYQMINENGELDTLIVCKCQNYQQDLPRHKANTKEELMRLKELKESIKILYFNAIDIDEADQIQSDLVNRGIIYEVNDFNRGLLSKKT